MASTTPKTPTKAARDSAAKAVTAATTNGYFGTDLKALNGTTRAGYTVTGGGVPLTNERDPIILPVLTPLEIPTMPNLSQFIAALLAVIALVALALGVNADHAQVYAIASIAFAVIGQTWPPRRV